MISILDILKYFGYSDPVAAYQTLPMDTICKLVHDYYEQNPI